jgi:hypothetical protein
VICVYLKSSSWVITRAQVITQAKQKWEDTSVLDGRSRKVSQERDRSSWDPSTLALLIAAVGVAALVGFAGLRMLRARR